MMSQDHQQPGDGGEEAGGDEEEEGDMEARTAVAALLALTLPTDYTYPGYDDNYLMETSQDDYLNKDLSAKCIPDYDDEDEDQPNVSRLQLIESSDVNDQPPPELKESTADSYSSLECQDVPDGLAHLRAYVQETEEKSDNEIEGLPKLTCDQSQSLYETRESSYSQIPVQDSKEEKPPVIDDHQNAPTLTLAASVPEHLAHRDCKEDVLPTLTKEGDLESTHERSLFSPKSKSSKEELFTGTRAAHSVQNVVEKYNQKSDIEMSSARADVPPPGLLKDFTKGKICSTLDDSDTDSDSDSDGDSDSDSSSSSSSDSDDGSDSDSDSDSDDSKDDKSGDLDKPEALSKSISSSSLQNILKDTKEIVKATSRESEVRNTNLPKDNGEIPPVSLKSKVPPIAKGEAKPFSDNVRHLATEKSKERETEKLNISGVQEKGSEREGRVYKQYTSSVEKNILEKPSRKEGNFPEKSPSKREGSVQDKALGKKDGGVSLKSEDGVSEKSNLKREGNVPDKTSERRGSVQDKDNESKGIVTDKSHERRRSVHEKTSERKLSIHEKTSERERKISVHEKTSERKQGVHDKIDEKRASVSDDREKTVLKKAERIEGSLPEKTDRKQASIFEKSKERIKSAHVKTEKAKDGECEKICEIGESSQAKAEKNERNNSGKPMKKEESSIENNSNKAEGSLYKKVIKKEESERESISNKRERSVHTYDRSPKLLRLNDRGKDSKNGVKSPESTGMNSMEIKDKSKSTPLKSGAKNFSLLMTRGKSKSPPTKSPVTMGKHTFVKTEKEKTVGAVVEKESEENSCKVKETKKSTTDSSSTKVGKVNGGSPGKDAKLPQKSSNQKEDSLKSSLSNSKVSSKKSKGTVKLSELAQQTPESKLSEQGSSQKQLTSQIKKKKNNLDSNCEPSKELSQKQHEKDVESQNKTLPSERLSSRENSTNSLASKNSNNDSSRRDSITDPSNDKDDDRFESEIDDMFPMPIQAEVVMSEGSESGIEYGDYDRVSQDDDTMQLLKRSGEILHLSDKENSELVAYLQSFVNGGGKGEIIEYPPSNNELPAEGTDLTQWQLDGVHLPPFTPNVAPPSWLRLTIPAEGYRCHSCGDTFFIESSLVQHRERRSVWINLECGPCDAKLTFYNRCALKDHLRMHLLRGEEVDEETVDVRSLPLQLTRLLQPILVPVPQSLMAGSIRCTSKIHGSVTKLPALKPIGKGAVKHLGDKMINGTLDENYTSEDYSVDEEGHSSPDKIPVGMKRLSPRRRTVRCYLCERMFHSVRELMAHMRTDQPYSDQRVECRKCQLVLPSVCAAKAHILTHPPANTSNVSVCPECGSRCDGPRDFVHHLNTCGHQFRRSGIVCTICQVCFFKSQDDFLTHWILEHCGKSYECVVCQNTFESLVFHNCQSPGQQVLATFRCLLTCPLCSESVQLNAQEESDANIKIEAHLADCHPSIITRVHYVYKSKFCTNAFRSKDELRAHHDREHRRDNHYRTKTCTLHHEVLGYQHQYFNGQEPRNAFVTLPVALSAEELHEARIRDVPTVSSVIDKTLFPDMPSLDCTKLNKSERQSKTKNSGKLNFSKETEVKDTSSKDSPSKKENDALDKLKPNVCYRCGYIFTDGKDFRRHKRSCEGEGRERQCQVCGWMGVGDDFARHCRSHIQENIILCMYCNGTQFSNYTDLEQHFELHVHEQFLYPSNCAFCSATLPDVPTALAHLGEEHDPFHIQADASEFECNRCGRHFHGERGLSVHLGRCTLGAATPTSSSMGCRQCQVCTKALTPEMFGRHMVSHLEEGLLVCSLCDGRTLPSSMALLHHLEEHAAALAYPTLCPMCNFSMVDSTSALTHMKEEHGFGNLLCADCDMHYNFTYQLQRHTDIVHKICLYAKRRYICWICRAYDHVKKETLMNHFRLVHGLDREQVDEKVMIRTRGQGTKPTSQFIPTKPLGSKEVPSLSPSKGTGETNVTKPQKEKSKALAGKQSSTLPDESQQSNKTQQIKVSPPGKASSQKLGLKKRDNKITDKTKVLIKRLPESVLDDQSRCKKLKIPFDEKRSIKKHKNKKKAKVYICSTCGFGTNNKEKHDNHMLKHKDVLQEDEPDGYVCSECGASFVVEPSLARHMFFAHKVKLPVASTDEEEYNISAQDKDTSVSIAKNSDSKSISSPVKTTNDTTEPVLESKDPVLTNKSLQEDTSNIASSKEVLNDNMNPDEETKDNKKLKNEKKKRKEVKSEVKPVVANKAPVEVKKRKIDVANEDISIKEEKCAPTIKQEDGLMDITVKEEKTIKAEEPIEEVREPLAKRKATRVTALKKCKKESLEVGKYLNQLKKEVGNTKKMRREVNKKQTIDAKKQQVEDSSKRGAIKETSKKSLKDSFISGGKKAKKKTSSKDNGKKKSKDYVISGKSSNSLDTNYDDHCVVCKEKFTNPVELYSHLRTHGMAFLKLGRKARPTGVSEKSLDN